jgi:hypothetical protein
MKHNYKASGSGSGGERSWQINLNEAEVLYRHHIQVLTEYCLPHD